MLGRPYIGRRGLIAGLGIVGAGFAAGSRPALATAASVPAPKGPVVLTVSGKIASHNLGDKAAFDMAMLGALPQAGFTTTNPWTPRSTFTGVLLSTLLQTLGSTGKLGYAYALNDYVVEIPLTDLTPDGPLLATKMNGQYMPVAHYGPIFVMYDFAKHPEWLHNDIYARCIWQLDRMVIS
ncbi:MAG: molybdopterin-dependent oxidoreductase [Proteobacteria bacterium]|nr:molybdopterin-dependent oxidoreductase [Pseudomonadota bacterium]